MLYFTRKLVENLQDQDRKPNQSLVETHQGSWRGWHSPAKWKTTILSYIILKVYVGRENQSLRFLEHGIKSYHSAIIGFIVASDC